MNQHLHHQGYADHHMHDHESTKIHQKENHFVLTLSATLHCLIGCGLGEVLGMVIGTWFGWDNTSTMILAIALGFVLGFGLGIIPLLRAGYSIKAAFRQVIVAEGLSIAVMETVEVLVQVNTPGVMDAHLHDWLFWKGMLLGLLAGFITAFPVNYWFIRKGIRHQH
ncbi:MAG TPA: DUF4396 domain-containing protein [Chitinophagaceae bacterium]|nr:DUF4396 domain-containing protein [Chitinophagaceae bacterium]